MRFDETGISGLLLIGIDLQHDDRGSFGRTFCRDEYRLRGIPQEFVQSSISRSERSGTIRGMHWQAHPHCETKLVRCTRGAIHDIVCDLRPNSKTTLGHKTFKLHQDDNLILCTPPGCAHGFQTLTDKVEISYSMSHAFVPAAARGCRYDDPAFSLAWPLPVVSISAKDLQWLPYFEQQG